ncbi:MAG: formylglycine-generating enzyme family protein, partial [Candidatus Delongbacteria bacterium]|nr:formylglycine-generating enzyme family protein [Candidatus Delongbacteria bacterium]MCG2761517.1 formylglycine-generating enzyme family protein [Candidatus Delongbacteria bacterium]
VGVNCVGTLQPVITVDPNNIDFGNVQIDTYSPVLSFTLTGRNMNESITVTPPSGFEISKSENLGYQANSLTFIQTLGNVDATVYIKIQPTELREYSGNIDCSSIGAISKTVSLLCTATAPPSEITVIPSILDFDDTFLYYYSAEKTFQMTGTDLIADLVVTPPWGFEISKTSGLGYTTASLSYIPSSGSVNSTVYVRIMPTEAVAYSGNIDCSSSYATSKSVSVNCVGVEKPVLYSSTYNLDFGDITVGSYSFEHSFELTGEHLKGNVVVSTNGSTVYEISKTPGHDFISTDFEFVPTEGNLNVIVYVRVKPAAAQLYQENITCLSADAGYINIGVSVQGIAPYGFVFIPGGTFDMGLVDVATPVHTVTISRSFFMGKFEVTQNEWIDIIGSSPPTGYGVGDGYPVYNVSWYDVLVYCNRRSIAEGLNPCYTIESSTNPDDWGSVPTSPNQFWDEVICDWGTNGYRLPTEAEWEYTVRYNDGRIYSWGDESPSNTLCNYNSNVGKTTTVGSYPSGVSQLGLHDMTGNVYELVWDWYDAYSSSSATDPTGPAGGSDRIVRGGCWTNTDLEIRCVNRSFGIPSGISYKYGFRLARTIE